MNTTERRRLRKLGKFMLTVVPRRFDMRVYLSEKFSAPYLAKQHLTNCGTSACALGWAGYLFPRLSAKAYSFERLADELFDIHPMTRDWFFLFCASWARRDNSPEFAARRIHLYLEKGLPSKWDIDTPESEWEWL
jgi:hypothetical protein